MRRPKSSHKRPKTYTGIDKLKPETDYASPPESQSWPESADTRASRVPTTSVGDSPRVVRYHAKVLKSID